MPTILFLNGWRFHFYSNEGNEPIHIHVQKAEMEAKFWLREDLFEVEEAFVYNMDSKEVREVRRIIFAHFDYLVEAWEKYHQVI
jgi:Domain of unknown function (DUF4160)